MILKSGWNRIKENVSVLEFFQVFSGFEKFFSTNIFWKILGFRWNFTYGPEKRAKSNKEICEFIRVFPNFHETFATFSTRPVLELFSGVLVKFYLRS